MAAASKAYDGTTSATLTSCTPSGVIAEDVVGCTGSAAFATASVGVGKTVTASGLTLTGADAGNYTLASTTATTTAAITALTVTPAVAVANKPYSGTTNATLTSCTLTGLLGGDVVSCTGTAAFATAGVGVGKTVTVSGLTLSGAAASNYALASPTATTTATITALTITPTVAAANKVYDGTASATLTSCTLTGLLGGDVVSCTGTAAFATAGVGAGKTVTASGLTLSGAAAGNYTLASTTAATTAAITARTVTPTVTIANKRYDATTSATIVSCLVSPTMGADQVACTGTASFTTASAGAGKTVTVTALALTGSAAGNYALASTTTTATATIQANQVPVVTNPGPQNTILGAGVSLALTASDLDGDALTWTATNLPPGVVINTSGGVSGTPTTVGTFNVTVSASDTWDTAQASFTWNVVLPALPAASTAVSPSGPVATATPAFSWSAVPRRGVLPALDLGCQRRHRPRPSGTRRKRPACATGVGHVHGGSAADADSGSRFLERDYVECGRLRTLVRDGQGEREHHGRVRADADGRRARRVDCHANADLHLERRHRRDLVSGFSDRLPRRRQRGVGVTGPGVRIVDLRRDAE